MFQPLKNLFSKLGRKQPTTPEAAPAPAAPPSKLAPPTKEPKQAAPRAAAPPPAAAAPAPAPVAPAAGGPPEETFALPLRVVLSRLPASLAASVKSTGGGDLQLPLRKVLAQLPQGSVKVSFGELRQAAPPGTFMEVGSQDSTMIELPLPEIVSRINPALISRRQDQKTIHVPEEVGNVFGPHGETIAPTASAAPVAAPAPAPAPVAAPAPAAPAPTAAPKPILPTPAAPPSSVALPKPPASPSAPSTPNIPKPSLPKPPTPAPSAPSPIAAPKLPTPPSVPKPPAPSSPSLPKPPAPAAPIAAPKLPSAPAPAVPKPAAPAPVTASDTNSTQFFLEKEAAPASGTLTVALSSLSGNWPESVKQEIAQNNLKDSNVALPMANVEAGLKTGKIVFSWREIGGWLEPKAFSTSTTGDTLVELPLKIIAPKFIEQHKPAKTQRKVAIGENIPDIFSGGAAAPKPAPAAAAPAPAAPKPAMPAPAPAAPVAAPSLPKLPTLPAAPAPAPVAAKVPTTMGEVFGNPAKQDWTPRDIVTMTSALKGLTGAVISTHDGLMVAGELPAPMKADTVAAFLPQIFSRMNQYAKDLQLGGDVSSITVMFDKTPWQISKLGKTFFAAAGRPGEPLPTAELAAICGDLAKQNK